MWLCSWDVVSFFVSKRVDNCWEPPGSLQLIALFGTKNESASEDETHMRKWIILYNYSVVMWVCSSYALSFFVSKRVDNCREPPGSLQLIALFDTKNDRASDDQTHMRTELFYTNIHFLMWVCCSDALSFFVPKRGNNWRESNRCLQLLTLFDRKNETVSEDQTQMTTE
jgi:hypothetical protein